MHVVATNICVWIRTVGKETLQEIVKHHLSQERGHPSSLEELILPFRGTGCTHSTSHNTQLFTRTTPNHPHYFINYNTLSSTTFYPIHKTLHSTIHDTVQFTTIYNTLPSTTFYHPQNSTLNYPRHYAIHNNLHYSS